MALDDDSQKNLDEARNGQARKFAMVCKGEKIISLVVFKSGSVDKYKAQAKEKGSGDFSHGEIAGKGLNLIFRVAKSDGFKEVPAKDQKLKEFLKTETGTAFTPAFALVESHSKGSESAEKPNAPPPAPSNAKEGADSKPDQKTESSKKPDSPKPNSETTKKMRETMTKLGPLVKAAVQNVPDRKTEILKTYARLQAEIEEDDGEKVLKDLMQYAALLQGLATAKPESEKKEDGGEAREWSGAKKKWAANKAAQLEAVKETMNALGNLALDEELDPDKVNALITELAKYVPTFEGLITALDKALEGAGESKEPDALAKIHAAIAGVRSFCNGARIQKLLADFDGKDFFQPTEESLNEISKLAS